MISHALERSSPDAQRRLKKHTFFFISISFPVKLQAWAFWWFASGPPKDKICVFMNYLFYNFTPSPSICLGNCLFHPSSLFVYHLNSLESWIWAIEDTIQYVFDSKLWVYSIRVSTSHNRWRFCLLIVHADPSDQQPKLGIDLEAYIISSTHLPAQLFSTLLNFTTLFADLAPGWQERKHCEHALPIAFQHRDRSADHL